jgi:hypothetical protein
MLVRRIIAAAGAAALAGGLLTAAASAPAATTPTIKVNGWTVGLVTQTEPAGTLTFVFTETNTGTKTISEALDGGDGAATLRNVTIVRAECIAEGISQGGDGHTCEPDLVPGETLTLVETADVTNVPGAVVSIRACTYPLDGPGPRVCKTVSAKVG